MQGLLAQEESVHGLRETQTQLDFTQFELGQYRGRVDDLELQLDRLLSGNNDQTQEIERLQEELTAETEQRLAAEGTLATTEADLAELTVEHEEAVAERDSLRIQGAKLRDDLWRTKAILSTTETDLAVLRQIDTKKTKELDRLIYSET